MTKNKPVLLDLNEKKLERTTAAHHGVRVRMLGTKHAFHINVNLPDKTHLFIVLKYTQRFFSSRVFQTDHLGHSRTFRRRHYWLEIARQCHCPPNKVHGRRRQGYHTTWTSSLAQSSPDDGSDARFERFHEHTGNRHCSPQLPANNTRWPDANNQLTSCTRTAH